MILVPNPLQLSNGNKYILILFLIVFISACSKRVVPVRPDGVKVPPVDQKNEEVRPVKKDIDHSVVLLLPFELNTINLKTAGAKELGKADLAVDFYQGFRLALDSLSKNGHNYKLQVFDTQDQEARVVNLARAASVNENDIVIGPVFPDALSTFSEFFEKNPAKLIVSPLAASLPSQFKNSNLVTVNNSVDQHGWKIADYIVRNYKPETVNIVLVNTKKNDDEKFSAPLRKYISELSKGKFKIVERPNAIGLQTYLSSTKSNVVILSSSDRAFLLPTIDKLYKLTTENYKIELVGHPNWTKASFLEGTKMQALKTKLTSSYFVDYKAGNVKNFIARYRDEFGFEPSEFSFKGFDVGYYFGGLLEKYGKDYAQHVGKELYYGLHNNFRFSKDPLTGYSNSELMLLTYRALELQPIR
ncbi:ABC transporter substrate-binding protein [Daejeonella lutea]|uniref:ABC-type branched-chain amino acid transport system, substrate-binding protein n=1 Tax=Daejeonella lutea TaxID=572036 RepID=A0A1T5A1S3_9SPHI|nr:ABC transporter substrate-binding protein [Daejeonella lutea]SKB28805.1 ABC-type branched-chain amino acid transport system, substrate-binding protein [Daejeonella lutea]